MPAANAVPARSRPDRPLEVVPPAQAQDAGLHRSKRRPLPHAAYAHTRDDRDLTRRRPGAAPERGSDRGDRSRPRPRASRVRHDLGHPAFGHAGEEALDAALRERFGLGFRHNEHSLRVVDQLERDGRGLNLTAEVRDGILNHTGENEPETLEGKIVRLVDRVAYINHDIDDAVRAGVLEPTALPAAEIELLGPTGPRRIDTIVHDLVETSERVRRIFAHLVDEGRSAQDATDYVAGMTDRFALAYAARLEG